MQIKMMCRGANVGTDRTTTSCSIAGDAMNIHSVYTQEKSQSQGEQNTFN